MNSNVTDAAVGVFLATPQALATNLMITDQQVAMAVSVAAAIITQVVIALCRAKGWVR